MVQKKAKKKHKNTTQRGKLLTTLLILDLLGVLLTLTHVGHPQDIQRLNISWINL